MFKKLFVFVAALMLAVAPLSFIGIEDAADAKRSYSSGSKSFKPSTTKPNNSSNITPKKQEPTSNTAAKTPVNQATSTASKGGFMKGMLYGGLAGLLLGGLFANMGGLGAILGLLVNVIAIGALIMLVMKVISYFKKQKSNKDMGTWKP